MRFLVTNLKAAAVPFLPFITIAGNVRTALKNSENGRRWPGECRSNVAVFARCAHILTTCNAQRFVCERSDKGHANETVTSCRRNDGARRIAGNSVGIASTVSGMPF